MAPVVMCKQHLTCIMRSQFPTTLTLPLASCLLVLVTQLCIVAAQAATPVVCQQPPTTACLHLHHLHHRPQLMLPRLLTTHSLRSSSQTGLS